MINCWWFAINFRWRSSPILFRFCRWSLPWCTLVNRIVGVFNDIYCRSLKIAQRFSIANNCKATNQIKRTRNKNRYEKKAISKFLQNREKPNFKLFVIFKSPEFLKGPILTAIGYTVWWRYPCHSSLLKKKTKTNQKETRNEKKCEKNRARGKTRQKKDNLNTELFVMLNLRS